MSLLDKPEAQALLNDATVTADTVRGCTDRLTGFLQQEGEHGLLALALLPSS
jgi:hypothetical protein